MACARPSLVSVQPQPLRPRQPSSERTGRGLALPLRVNLGGAAYLGTLLSQLPPGVRLPDELGLIQGAFPLLVTYALAYVAIPAARLVRLQAKNGAVEERNSNRRAWRDRLRRGGDDVRKRLTAASRQARAVRLVDEGDIAYDSALDLTEQLDATDPSLDEFDRRLRERSEPSQSP